MAAHDSDPNTIDVSLNIMSDATLAAVNKLTDQLSTLREFLVAQGMAGNPAAQAQSAGGSWSQAGAQVSYSRPGSVQAGIFHGPSGSVQQGPENNPTANAEESRKRADKRAKELRWEVEDYRSDMAEQSGARPGWGPGGKIPSRSGPVDSDMVVNPPSPDANAMMSRHMSDSQNWKLAGQEARVKGGSRMDRYGMRMDKFFSRYQGTSRDPNEDHTYENVSGQTGGEGMPAGIISTADGPTGPPPINPNDPGWSQTLQRDGISSTTRIGMTVPRLGEFTTQDKLRMFAKVVGSGAQRRQEDGNVGAGTQMMGRAAAGASYLADNAALLTSLHHGLQRAKGFADEQTASGTELGFSADTGVEAEFLGVGARLNLPGMSEASREGLKEEMTQRRVAAAAGVSTAQAKEIRATVRGMGYSGDTAANLSYNLFKPLAKRGISAETWAPVVDQGFRQGTMTVNELKDAVIGLSESAKNASLTADQARDSTIAYTEAMQSMGGGLKNATRGAETMMTAGLDPQIAASAMKNPLTQGVATMKFGIPADMQGVLGPAMQGEAMDESANIAMAAGSGYLNSPDAVLKSSDGQVIERVTGEDKRLAFASNMSGIPRTVLERIQRNPKFLGDGLKAATMITAMGDDIASKKAKSSKTTKHTEYGKKTGLVEGALRKHDSINWLYKNVLDRGSGDGDEVTKTTAGKLTKAQEDALKGSDPNNKTIQYGELEDQLRQMDPTDKGWLDKVTKLTKKDGTINLKDAKKLVKEATDPTKEPDYLVGLTNQAKGLLTIKPSKKRKDAQDDANKGGAAVNAAYAGVNTGNTPTGAAAQGEQNNPSGRTG